jgi:hypothetical protein
MLIGSTTVDWTAATAATVIVAAAGLFIFTKPQPRLIQGAAALAGAIGVVG